MKISKKWLQDFVFFPDSLTADELGRELTLRTVEVEGVEKQAAAFENIVVGEIVFVEKHPNADKLKVCQVNVGSETVQIVCGGSNVAEKMKVIVAKVGAKVKWHGEGELIELGKVSLRGVDSAGMICASDEVGLADKFPKKDEKEIVDISSSKAKAGMLLCEFLHMDDVVLEVDNKSLSNRPDLWGHYGMAREISALYRKKLNPYTVPEIPDRGRDHDSGHGIDVKVEDAELCPRYMAVAVSGITIAPSPEKIQQRLQAVGIRPINNIVDITNYVMMELGQPTHAFDAARLTKKSLVVRRAKEGEKFKTLDEKEHTLSSNMLMITDGEKSLAIAGVMGGEESGISNDTNTVIFESANFNGSSIRKTSTTLGFRTDSSARFEKGLDPANAEIALKRLVQLTLEVCPSAKVVSIVADVSNVKAENRVIELSEEIVTQKLGTHVDPKQIVQILQNLGFGVAKQKKSLLITVPTFRYKDVSIKEDLIEEIARVYGYEKIVSSLPMFTITPPLENKAKTVERKIKEILALECGFTETYNYSFESPEWLKRLGVDTSMHLELENPVAKDRPFIRRSVIPNLLENVESNLHRYDEVKMFETGRVYRIEKAGERVEPQSHELLPRQDLYLGMVVAKKGESVPFFSLSATLQNLFARLSVAYELRTTEPQNEKTELSFLHPGRRAFIYVNGQWIGTIGELHPHLQGNTGIDERVAVLQLNLSTLNENFVEEVRYEPLAVFPAVKRDIAFVLPRTTAHAQVVATLQAVDPLIRSVELFDIYEGEKLGADKKSMAYHITYASSDHTLTAEEVEKVHGQVLKVLEKEFEAELRK